MQAPVEAPAKGVRFDASPPALVRRMVEPARQDAPAHAAAQANAQPCSSRTRGAPCVGLGGVCDGRRLAVTPPHRALAAPSRARAEAPGTPPPHGSDPVLALPRNDAERRGGRKRKGRETSPGAPEGSRRGGPKARSPRPPLAYTTRAPSATPVITGDQEHADVQVAPRPRHHLVHRRRRLAVDLRPRRPRGFAGAISLPHPHRAGHRLAGRSGGGPRPLRRVRRAMAGEGGAAAHPRRLPRLQRRRGHALAR